MSNVPARMPDEVYRRGVIACARENCSPRKVTHDEAVRVEAVTIGERINFEIIAALYGRQHADDWRARLGL